MIRSSRPKLKPHFGPRRPHRHPEQDRRQNSLISVLASSQKTDMRMSTKSAWLSDLPLLMVRTKTSETCSSFIEAENSIAVNRDLSSNEAA